MAIERCDKCGKSFMSKSEVDRHKAWEHPVPVSPFEERPVAAAANRVVNPKDLRKLTGEVMAGSKNTSDVTTIGGGKRSKVPFKPFRL
jgi:hypothetical protein